ncbi:hypothetical protein, partial [Leyella stercorea]
NHMYQKDKSESYLMNNCLSGTMSLGANLLSIFVPSYFLTVTYYLKESEKAEKLLVLFGRYAEKIYICAVLVT